MQTSQISLHQAALELDARRKARISLLAFTKYTNQQYIAAPHHALIADKLEAVARGEIKRLMIMMPPRHGKSELASRRFPAWYLGRYPTKQIIAASYSSDLAGDFGREVRNIVADPEYNNVFPNVALAQDSKAANRWHTSEGGMYVAAGVGTAITGRGADILLIDDPFKDRASADSEVNRNNVWDWYTSTAYTRLMPGGAAVVINCLVGDTLVLMADGSQRNLRDIKVGDAISTFNNGKLTRSTVKNWASQGCDKVYSIRTSSGIIVTGNKRHPFLVARDGVLEWIRLEKIQQGDMIVRATLNGESGRALNAQLKDAGNQLAARDIVHRTTTRQSGQADIDLLPSTQNHNLQRMLSTDTESPRISTGLCLKSRTGSAQFAELNTEQSTGEISSVSTITMKRELSEDYSAIIAISPLDRERLRKFYVELPNISEFTLDAVVCIEYAGEEEVFDIQVEGTENFVANGLVSHNTRWHDDDLSGRLLEAQDNGGDQWEILCMPAIGDDGHALWAEWYPISRLQEIQSVLPPRDWNSLYQQNPIPDEGDYFKSDWFGTYDVAPNNLKIYGASDYAVTPDGGDYTEHGIIGIDASSNVYVLDWWRGKTTADVWIDAKADLIIKHNPSCWFGEAGVIRRAVEPFMMRRLQEREAYCRIEWMPSITGKEHRAQSFQAMASMGKVFMPKKARWLPELMAQLLRFPAAKHDDGVDVLSLFGRGIKLIRPPKSAHNDELHRYDIAQVGGAQSWMG